MQQITFNDLPEHCVYQIIEFVPWQAFLDVSQCSRFLHHITTKWLQNNNYNKYEILQLMIMDRIYDCACPQYRMSIYVPKQRLHLCEICINNSLMYSKKPCVKLHPNIAIKLRLSGRMLRALKIEKEENQFYYNNRIGGKIQQCVKYGNGVPYLGIEYYYNLDELQYAYDFFYGQDDFFEISGIYKNRIHAIDKRLPYAFQTYLLLIDPPTYQRMKFIQNKLKYFFTDYLSREYDGFYQQCKRAKLIYDNLPELLKTRDVVKQILSRKISVKDYCTTMYMSLYLFWQFSDHSQPKVIFKHFLDGKYTATKAIKKCHKYRARQSLKRGRLMI